MKSRSCLPLASCVAALLPAADSVRAQDSLLTLNGSAAVEQFGASVANAGDVDADGVPDIVVGSPGDAHSGQQAGAVRIYSGATGTLLWTELGSAAADFLGWAVSGAGDVNADGRDDFIGGAISTSGQGYARVYSGLDGSILASVTSGTPGDFFGGAVTGLGDVDLDGFDDFAVGAQVHDGNGTDAGRVFVFSGVSGGVMRIIDGESAGDNFGKAVSGIGDVNLDGYADLIVGAPYDQTPHGLDAGSASVISGAYCANGTQPAVLFFLDGAAPANFFGTSVGGAGDIDGDGRPEVIVGAPNASQGGLASGTVSVFRGSDGSLLFRVAGAAFDKLGESVGGTGDVDADGTPDFIAGSIEFDNGRGYARLFSGCDGRAIYTFSGVVLGDGCGTCVGGLGDLNNDGRADVAVGFPGDDTVAHNSGKVEVFSGLTRPVLTPPVPGIAGMNNTLEVVAGATPGGKVYFISGTVAGSTQIRGCPGVTVGIANPKIRGIAVSSACGAAFISAYVPAGASGRTFLLQAHDRASCGVSDVLSFTFQ